MTDILHISAEIQGTPYPEQAIEDAVQAVKRVFPQDKRPPILYVLRVLGENRINIIIDGQADVLLSAINGVIGDKVTFTSTPLIHYDVFARNVAKVPEGNCHRQEKEFEPTFHLTVDVEQGDLTQEKLLEIWREEGIAAMGAIAAGAKMVIFKTVGLRQVIALNSDTGESGDGLTFNLPLFKQIGGNCRATFKRVARLY